MGLNPGLGRSPEIGNGNLLQYSSCKTLWATVHWAAESDTTDHYSGSPKLIWESRNKRRYGSTAYGITYVISLVTCLYILFYFYFGLPDIPCKAMTCIRDIICLLQFALFCLLFRKLGIYTWKDAKVEYFHRTALLPPRTVPPPPPLQDQEKNVCFSVKRFKGIEDKNIVVCIFI